jgi:hypothetical protein
MLHQAIAFHPRTGWNCALPTELNGPQTLVLVFAGAAAAQAGHPCSAALRELTQAFSGSVLAGCSSAGEIQTDRVHDEGLTAVVAQFQHSLLAHAQTAIAGAQDSQAAGQRLAAQLTGTWPQESLRAVLVLSDGLQINGSALVEGLTAALPAGVVITGGLAGDGDRFQNTWVLDGAQPRRQHVLAIGFYGERLRVGHGCNGGWADFGPERAITKAAGNVLYELDGRPALDLYTHYLGDRASGLPGAALLFPLAVRSEGSGAAVVRTVLSIDEQNRSMTFAGDIPHGGVARLMRSSTERLIESAGRAAVQAFSLPDSGLSSLAVTVSCVGRRLMLGERTDEEIEAVLEQAPADCSQVGFYSYGEIAPAQHGRPSQLHNQTLTVTVFSEA